MVADDVLDCAVDSLRVRYNIAGQLNRFIEPQNMVLFSAVPKSKARNDGSPGVKGKLHKSRACASEPSEEIDENAFSSSSVLINKNAHSLVVPQRFHNQPRGIPFQDQPIT